MVDNAIPSQRQTHTDIINQTLHYQRLCLLFFYGWVISCCKKHVIKCLIQCRHNTITFLNQGTGATNGLGVKSVTAQIKMVFLVPYLTL